MNAFLSRNDLLSPKQTAALVGVPVETIRYYLDRGILPYERSGQARRTMRRIRRKDALGLFK